MGFEKTLLIVIIITLILLGGIGIFIMAFEEPFYPKEPALNSGLMQGQTTLVSYSVVTGETQEQILIKNLEEKIKLLEGEIQKQEQGYFCDETGCYMKTVHYARYGTYEPDYYTTDHDKGEYDLIVTVKDEETGERLEDAKVSIENDDSMTRYSDEDGEAKFRNLEEDCYDIKASKSGYNTEYDDACLRKDKKITLYLEKD